MSQQIFSVFVGDLSIFCNESHIKLAFAKFGEIMAVRIAFDEESHKQLPYGFVDFATTESANEAMASMDGTILCGRRIRVKWATNRRKEIVEVKAPAWNDDYGTASVHVIYLSYKCETRITEEFLRTLFSKYGEVQDVMIKKSSFNQENSMQKGYGFVHFLDNEEGIKASLSAVEDLFDSTVDNVNYTCSISRTFERKLISSGAGSPVVHSVSGDDNQTPIDEKVRAAFVLPAGAMRPTSWPRQHSPQQMSGSPGSMENNNFNGRSPNGNNNSNNGNNRPYHVVSPPRSSNNRGNEHRQHQQHHHHQQQQSYNQGHNNGHNSQNFQPPRQGQDPRFTYASCPANYLPPRGIAMQMQAQQAYYGQQQQQRSASPMLWSQMGDAPGPVYYSTPAQQNYAYPLDAYQYSRQMQQQQQAQQAPHNRMQSQSPPQHQQFAYPTPPPVYPQQQTYTSADENGAAYYYPQQQQQQQYVQGQQQGQY